jgi:hypothetical protein
MPVRFLKSESSHAFSATSCVSELSALCVKIRFLVFLFCSQLSTVDCRLVLTPTIPALDIRRRMSTLSLSKGSPLILPFSCSSCPALTPIIPSHTTPPGEGGYTGPLVRPRDSRSN